MDLSKTGVTENSEDASSDSEVAQFYRPGLQRTFCMLRLLCSLDRPISRPVWYVAETHKV